VDVVDALRTLQGMCRQPVVTHRPPDALVLPTPSDAGTVILRDVSCLSLNDQHRLMAWLDGNCGRTQIIATDTRPVWPRLQTGAFLASLYYRLNIIYVDLMRQANK
jgi:transcriptional regulator of acetoin/glycerol metabolism